ncbi:Alpha-aminoadipic semialdehyde synthase, mitochondrial [Leucoagaricus sp. SymC.cos]|nr:Alpha-aminoadipic semialdehyde synthase, mitochondrial [Leucoagaricus sp. SymC.cos]
MRPSRKALQKLTLGLRREDPHRIWERRAALTPDAVNQLVEGEGVEVVVEPCERRVFTNREYEKAGAKLSASLDHAHIVVGIKETPMDALARQRSPVRLSDTTTLVPRTHVMFSHTAKGQPYNTGLLSQFVAPTDRVLGESAARFEKTMELWPRLIDYELLTNDEGKRTVGFGWFAGVAGVLESLSAMAHAHLELGIASPFLYTPRPHTLPSLERLRAALREVGLWISTQGTPRALGPVVICVTGTGNVARGSLSMLDELPLKKISASELERLYYDNTKVYLVHAKPEDYFVRKDRRTFDRQDYYANPSEWECVFGERIMPYVTLLINGTGWSTGFPRLLSTKQLASAIAKAQSLNLPGAATRGKCIGDISCDIGGGLEFLERSTTLSEPTYKFAVSDTSGQTTMMSVDILPTALPLDASNHFSKEFYPYLRTLIQNAKTHDPGSSNEWKGGIDTKYTEALERATIASRGQLRKKHQWLQPPVDKWHEEQRGVGQVDNSAPVQLGGTGAPDTVNVGSRTKKVLIFGSGMVAGPAVQEIAKRRDIDLVIGTNMLGEAQQLAIRHGQEHNNIKYRIVDIARRETYEHLIKDADVVISLLPAAFHVEVAEMCIANRKHLVTASYISEGMRDLHDRAIQADVLLLNEIGLDPGIDHCSAISLINKLKAQGKEIVSFTSFCGGLPVVKLPGEDLLRSAFPRLPIPLMQGVELEGIANRDSLPYRETYGLQNEGSLRTLVRGTLRYPGFCSLMQSFKDLGLLEDTSKISISSWDTLLPTALAHKVKSSCGFDVDMDNRSLESIMRDVVPWDRNVFGETLSALEWLGLWSSANGVGGGGAGKMNGVHVPMIPHTPLEFFAMVLAHRLRYAATERDMVVLSHEVITQAYGIHKSTLVTYATDSSNSAMARTVGLPIAFAALDVLDGKVKMRGVGGPGDESGVCESVLERLEGVGLGMVESVESVKGVGVGSGGVEERLVGCLM